MVWTAASVIGVPRVMMWAFVVALAFCCGEVSRGFCVFEAARWVYVVDGATDYQDFPSCCVVHDRISAHRVAVTGTIPRRRLAACSIGVIPIHSCARSCLKDGCIRPGEQHRLQHV